MSMNIYKTGQKVRVSVTFTVNDVATDPTAVVCKIKDPGGNVTTFTYGVDAEVVKDSTGVYHVDVTTDENRIWYYRFEGSGSCTAVEEAGFLARSNF